MDSCLVPGFSSNSWSFSHFFYDVGVDVRCVALIMLRDTFLLCLVNARNTAFTSNGTIHKFFFFSGTSMR